MQFFAQTRIAQLRSAQPSLPHYSATSTVHQLPDTVITKKGAPPQYRLRRETGRHEQWPDCTHRILASLPVAQTHQTQHRRVGKLMPGVADLTNKRSKMGKSQQNNLPWPSTPGLMAQDAVVPCSFPGDKEGDWEIGWVLLWSYDQFNNVAIYIWSQFFPSWLPFFSPSYSPGISTLNKTLACIRTFASGSVF